MTTRLPGLAAFRAYDRRWLRADIVAGVTVAAYLVPQVMAYGELAGLPAVVGLWAILAPLGVYAVLGSSRLLSIGPESTTAIMTATAVGAVAGGSPSDYAALAAALAILVGALCLVAALLRLGFLAELLSRPVLVGYLAGVALIMIGGQLGKLTGVSIGSDRFFGQVLDVVTDLDEVEMATLLLGAGVLVLLFASQRVAPRAPGPLIAVLLATAAVAWFDLDQRGIAVVGTISSGLPRPGLPDVHGGDLVRLLPAAASIAVVAFTDNVLTGRAFAPRREPIDPNQELLALGTANVATSLLQGFPVSSSGSRTALADSLGARTQLWSLVSLAAVVAVLLVAGDLLAKFPIPALAALVVYAAVRLIDLAELGRFARFRRSELVLALAATLGVLALGILYGVLAAIALSGVELLARIARPHDAVLGEVPGVAGLHDVDDYPEALTVPGFVVYRYDAPLCFANAENFKRRARAAVDAQAAVVEWFVLNVEANVEIDITGADAIEDLRAELADRGIVLALARVKHDLRVLLERSGLVERIGEEHLFPTLPTARAGFEHRHDPPP